ncbi:MAG: efflux RND transporter permease subunit, partial [Gammaproteobacteria bacterium]|nr:efflux RND transporter permease subunit [Gammaproteobacteria bacterium]
MNLSRWGIKYPLPSVLLFVVLVLAGLWGWRLLPISQLPDIALPTIRITVNYSGAPPATMETDVTRKIEDAIASIPGIDRINSSISEGTTVTNI